MANTQTRKPLTDILTSDDFTIRAEPLKADSYKQGDLLTYDGDLFSKASLASGDDHTESYAIVYEDNTIGTDGEKVAIIIEASVDELMLSADYQALSDDDKKAVNKELVAKNIIPEQR